MAKLTIMGDVLQIKSELTGKELARVKAFTPEALKLIDTDGNEVFGVDVGDASCSRYGICFCSEDENGKLFMTTENPVCDHSDAEAEKTAVIKRYAPMLSKLTAVENQINAAKTVLEEMEASVTDSVTFVG